MSVTFWVLMMVALVLVYLFGAIVWLYIRRGRKLNRMRRQALQQKPPQEPDEPIVLPAGLSESEQTQYLTIKTLIKKKYDTVKKSLKIPPGAVPAQRRIDVFCLSNCDITHYCWADSSNLYFFPMWESIEAGLDAGGIQHYRQGDENILHMLKLPESSVNCWRVLPDGMVQLIFSSKTVERADLLFDRTVARVLDKLAPEKKLDYLMKHVYPKSSQNIFDIRKEFSRVNRSWKKGRITDEEYHDKKLRILITM